MTIKAQLQQHRKEILEISARYGICWHIIILKLILMWFG